VAKITEALGQRVTTSVHSSFDLLSSRELDQLYEALQRNKAEDKDTIDKLIEVSNIWDAIGEYQEDISDYWDLYNDSRRAYASALASSDLRDYMNSYVFLYQCVERLLGSTFANICSQKYPSPKEMQQVLQLPSKDITSVSMGHLLKAIAIYQKTHGDFQLSRKALSSLNRMTELRNALVHARADEDIDVDVLKQSYVDLCRVLKEIVEIKGTLK